ncbi:Excision repair cross-complementing rodent repair deficiency, complementation group 5, variant 2 [Chamberlinius hualienensis]
MATRRDRQKIAAKDVEKTRRQILNKYIQNKSVKAVLNSKTSKSDHAQLKRNDFSLPSTSQSSDLFELPPIPPQLNNDSYMSSGSDYDSENGEREVAYQNLDTIDFESQDFKSLPLEIQHEFLVELRERSKHRSWFKGEELPEDSEKIGSFQVQQLLARRKIRKRLDDVKKELDIHLTGSIISSMDENELGSLPDERFSVARRIVSEDFAHYLLFKNVSVNNGKSEKVANKSEKKEVLSSTSEAVEVTTEKNKVDEQIVNDREDLDSDETEISVVVNEADIAKWMQMPDDATTESHRMEEVVLSEDDEEQVYENKANKVNIFAKANFEHKTNTEAKHEVETSLATIRNVELSSESKVKAKSDQESSSFEQNTRTEEISKSKEELRPDSPNVPIASAKPKSVINPLSAVRDGKPDLSIANYSEVLIESSDDEFMEVIVDASKAEEDHLFPIEIFKTSDNDLKSSVEASNLLTEMKMVENQTEDEAVEFVGDLLTKSNTELQLLSEDLDASLEKLVQEKGRQERIAATITDQMYVEGQELLRQFGIPFVVSPAEAEAQCATLESLGLTEGTITDDSDIWLFGAKHVYKHFFEKGRDPLHFNDAEIKDRFSLERSRLIAIAFLTGSDYTDGVKGIGVVKALEILAEFPGDDGFKSLKEFRKWWDQAQRQRVAPSETKVKQYLRKLELTEGFPNEAVLRAYTEPLVDSSTEKFSWSTPDLDALRQLANIKLNWNREKTDSILLPVMKKLSSMQPKQLQLSHFGFTCSRVHPKINQQSKRLVRALNKVKDLTKADSNLKVDEGKKLTEAKKPRGDRKRALSNIRQGQTLATAVPIGRLARKRSANSKAKVQNKGNLELSETSDSSTEQPSDDDKNSVASTKRKL